MAQTMRFHREWHVRTNAIEITLDPNVDGKLPQGRKRIIRQDRQQNDRVESQQVFGLDNQIQIGADLEDVKFLHRAKDGSEPDAIREPPCF